MRTKRVLRRSKTAVSPVISTILLVNIALAAGVLYFAWSQAALTKSYSVTELLYRTSIDKSKEALVVEDARYLPTTSQYTLNITIRHIGVVDTHIVALYLNQTEILWDVDDPNPTQEDYNRILHHQNLTFRFKDPLPLINGETLDVGDIVDIIVITKRGTKTTVQWEVSP